jgi:hypothetical protein
MSDALVIGTVITAIFSAVGGLFISLKVKFCKCFCITSECQRTPPSSPKEKNETQIRRKLPSIKNIFKRTSRINNIPVDVASLHQG